MAKTNKIVYVTQAQYDALVSSGTITVGGVTYTYDANNTYMVREDGIEGVDVLSTSETSGKVLTADGSGGSYWQTVSAGAPEGTAVKSTGVTSGKVLTANGSGGSTWETAGGGSGDVTASGTLSTGAVILGLGDKTITSSSGTSGKFLRWSGGATWSSIYKHTIHATRTSGTYTAVDIYFTVLSTASTAYTSLTGIPYGTYVASGNIDQTAFNQGQCRVLYFTRAASNSLGYWDSVNNIVATDGFSSGVTITDDVHSI